MSFLVPPAVLAVARTLDAPALVLALEAITAVRESPLSIRTRSK
ncbi:hypothetical protein DB30_05103 [Enhygromyxa salina]|uniref:Uncharacterized protein n=1 Tax=Enhygromyxa salina TaxID=215803 RepID=A0A0C2D7A5_9BACT|nr:hypothetical protein DB30_05103 [Enhygromyxa salina]